MPTMTADMLTSAHTLKGWIRTIDDTLDSARVEANTLMDLLYSVVGTDAAAAHIGGNAVYKLRSAFKELRALMDDAHAEVSTAAIVYDPVNGVALVHYAPPGGGGGGR